VEVGVRPATGPCEQLVGLGVVAVDVLGDVGGVEAGEYFDAGGTVGAACLDRRVGHRVLLSSR
jgi:hypothetical protein